MNKFIEQNKVTAKNETQANNGTAGVADAAAETNPMAKAVAADKAKIAAATQKPAEAVQKDAFNGKWHNQIKAAKNNWNKLSESELLKSGGVETNLTELVQQRYSLSRDVASKQVKSFIDKCHC